MKKPSKIRRRDGYVTPNLTIRAKRKFIIDNCLEPQEFYDDWQDYRDGQRNRYGDQTLKKFDKDLRASKWRWQEDVNKVVETNEKIKRKERIRKARKESRRKFG